MKKLRIPHCRHIFKIKSKIVERGNIDTANTDITTHGSKGKVEIQLFEIYTEKKLY